MTEGVPMSGSHCQTRHTFSIYKYVMAQMVSNPAAMPETQVRSRCREDPLEEGMATHSSTLAWEIPWIEEPGGLQPVGPKEPGTPEQLTLSLWRVWQGWGGQGLEGLVSVGCRQHTAKQALCESFVYVNISSDAVGCGMPWHRDGGWFCEWEGTRWMLGKHRCLNKQRVSDLWKALETHCINLDFSVLLECNLAWEWRPYSSSPSPHPQPTPNLVHNFVLSTYLFKSLGVEWWMESINERMKQWMSGEGDELTFITRPAIEPWCLTLWHLVGAP